MAAQVQGSIPVLGPILRRPYLLTAIVVGVVLYFATGMWITRSITRILIGWDSGVILFLVLTFIFMRDADIERMKRKAVEHDEGGHLILLLTIFASIASVGALIAELMNAKGQAD